MKGLAIAGTVAAFAVTAATAIYAQEPPTPPGIDKTAAASRADEQRFVSEMAIAGMAEVQLGKLASERASHSDVKDFGQLMVKDHSKAGEELKGIASQLKIQVPAELDQQHKDLHARLSTLQGAEFDREYMNAMVKGHEEVLGKLKAHTDARLPARGAGGVRADEGKHDEASAAGRAPGSQPANPPGAQSSDKSSPTRGDVTGRGRGDDRLTQWAAQALPRVQQHLDRAREIQKKVAK